MDRDAVGWRYPRHYRAPLRRRLHRDVHHRRAIGRHARLAARRPAADRHVLRRGAHSLRAVRRHRPGAVRRHLLLVAQDDGPAAERAARQMALLADVPRDERGVLPDALDRPAGDAAPHLHLLAGPGRQRVEPGLDGRRFPDRGRDSRLPGERAAHPDARAARPERSVGRGHAGVEYPFAAAGLQLLRHPHGREPAAALEDRAPRADARPAGRSAGPDPRPGRFVVAAGRGAGTARPRTRPAHAHAVARVYRSRDPPGRHLPLGLRALRALSDDARRGHPSHQYGARQPEDRVLGVHRLGVPAVHVAHLDLPRLQGQERGGPLAARDPEHSLHVGQHLRPVDVEPHDGAGAGRRAAGRYEVGEDLAVRDGAARARVPRRAGDRVHRVRAQGAHPPDQPVRLHVLRADRDARRARDRRRPLAAHAVGAGAAGEARAGARPHGRDHRAVLALRGRGLDRHLHGGLSDSIDGGTAMAEGDHPNEQAHPRPETYLRVAAALVVLTVLEVGVVLLGGLYVFLGGVAAPRRRVASFVGALGVAFLALDGPLHNLSDNYLFSAHMAQHLVLTLLFPPLLLYGTPAWVVRPLIRPRRLFRVAAVLTRPLPAAVIFSTPITLWHFPGLSASRRSRRPGGGG